MSGATDRPFRCPCILSRALGHSSCPRCLCPCGGRAPCECAAGLLCPKVAMASFWALFCFLRSCSKGGPGISTTSGTRWLPSWESNIIQAVRYTDLSLPPPTFPKLAACLKHGEAACFGLRTAQLKHHWILMQSLVLGSMCPGISIG